MQTITCLITEAVNLIIGQIDWPYKRTFKPQSYLKPLCSKKLSNKRGDSYSNTS